MTMEAANRTAHFDAPGQYIPVVGKLKALQSHIGDQNREDVMYLIHHRGMWRDIPSRQGEHLVIVQLWQTWNRCLNCFVWEDLVTWARTWTPLMIDLRAACSLIPGFDPQIK